MIVIVGHIGSDAGWTYIDGQGNVHHVGGWAEESMADLRSAVAVMTAASNIKAPGVAEAAIKSVHALVQRELGEHLGEGGVLVLAP
jgi:hypothetical protein